MAKIYTKTGDDGTTGTFLGRIGKGEELAEVLGTIDELNSIIGVCRDDIKLKLQIKNNKLQKINLETELKRIQTNLMGIAAGFAGAEVKSSKIKIQEVDHLEKLIDNLSENLPEIKNFIYPVGNLQYTRAVARRTERNIMRFMNQEIRFMNKTILMYLNRLSDALFVMGRWVNKQQKIEEEIWKG